MWYTVVVIVPAGQGDFGGTRRCIADGPMLTSMMARTVNLHETSGSLVEVYRGKHRGQRIYRTERGPLTKEDTL